LKRPRPPLFLARAGYRQRRMRDAARILPLVGIVLLLQPILWQPAATPEPDTAAGGIYLFAVWFGLILAAAWLAPRLDITDISPGDGAGEENG